MERRRIDVGTRGTGAEPAHDGEAQLGGAGNRLGHQKHLDPERYFEPLNYNYGAVWPFLTSWVATAQYRHHLPLQGYTSLMASVNHTFDNALGYVTEVFSGYQNIWPQEAVPHQGFCSAGVVLPLVRGMLGLETDVPGRRVSIRSALPPRLERGDR